MKLPYEDKQLIGWFGESMKSASTAENVGWLFLPGDFHYKIWGEYYDKYLSNFWKQPQKKKKEN
jgi:hypothetical protein